VITATSYELVVQTTAWPHQISGQVLSSHSVVSSSRIVSPCSPWGDRWIGHWRTTWSTVCSAPHSQATEEARQERKRPTSVRRRLSRTQVLLGRVGAGMKIRRRVGLSAHCAARVLLLSDKLMRCAAGTNRCRDLKRRASALDRRMSAEWSRCPSSVARRTRNSVDPLRRRSAGWMPARIERLSAGVGRRHPVSILKAPLMAGQWTRQARSTLRLRLNTATRWIYINCQ